jgi:hypothetical protein
MSCAGQERHFGIHVTTYSILSFSRRAKKEKATLAKGIWVVDLKIDRVEFGPAPLHDEQDAKKRGFNVGPLAGFAAEDEEPVAL